MGGGRWAIVRGKEQLSRGWTSWWYSKYRAFQLRGENRCWDGVSKSISSRSLLGAPHEDAWSARDRLYSQIASARYEMKSTAYTSQIETPAIILEVEVPVVVELRRAKLGPCLHLKGVDRKDLLPTVSGAFDCQSHML